MLIPIQIFHPYQTFYYPNMYDLISEYESIYGNDVFCCTVLGIFNYNEGETTLYSMTTLTNITRSRCSY